MIGLKEFKKKLNVKSSDRKQNETDVLEFSNNLRSVLDLSKEEMAQMAQGGETLDIQELGISIRITHRIFSSGWHDLFEVNPIEHHQVGYSNQVDLVPDEWIFEPRGTATICLPDIELRQVILSHLRSMEEND